MSRIIKILVLDDDDICWAWGELPVPGVTLEVTGELSLPGTHRNSPYGHPSDELKSWITNNASKFDYIVIGYNRGAGLAKAKAIPEAAKPNTVITSNSILSIEVAKQFTDLNFHNLVPRLHAMPWLRDRVAAEQ